MTPNNELKSFNTYAAQSRYAYENMQEYEEQAPINFERGFEPLESLPATWYNTVIKELTKQAQAIKALGDSMYAELSNVITAAGYELSAADLTQLKTSLDKLYATYATTGSAGPVKLAADYSAEGASQGNSVVTKEMLRGLLDSITFELDQTTKHLKLSIGDISKDVDLSSAVASVKWADKAGMLTNSASATSGATCDASRNLRAYTLTLG